MMQRLYRSIIRLRCQCHGRRGSILITSIVLIIIASFTVLWLGDTMLEHQRQNTRRRELWRAFYCAEAGLAQFQSWALNPNTYTDPTLFVASGTSGSFAERYPALSQAIDNGFELDESDLDQMDINTLDSASNGNVGKFTSIRLLPPGNNDPVSCVFRIESTGRSFRGVERKVLGYANMNPVVSIQIPAALISYNAIGMAGNVKVHWGEAWSKNNMEMQSQNQYSYLSTDPYAIWRTEGLINDWGGGWSVDTTRNPDVYTTQNDMGDVSAGDDTYEGRFLQNQLPEDFPAEWPTFDYETFKNLALSNGRYYTTDSSGNIYKDGVEVDFYTEFADYNPTVYDLVFIDTIDQQPPAADGSNLSTISISGDSEGIKGIFYIGANFDVAGVGSPPTVVATDPDSYEFSLSNIFLDGVLYAAGTLAMAGNAGVYGSVVTQMGFVGNGTPDVYYNSELANGINMGNGNGGPVFQITLQTNYGG